MYLIRCNITILYLLSERKVLSLYITGQSHLFDFHVISMLLSGFTFFKYKKDVISTTDENFGSPSSNLRTDNTKNVLKLRDTIITKKLKRLNNKIFALPMNKTKNNVSFLYQRHYPETLVNELDFNNVIKIASKSLEVIESVGQIILDNTSSMKTLQLH